ncbi:MAG: phosphoribosyl-AMP cyclohydrolase [Niveispirillum sp.]|uniref:phosphoribosyl-AMP cyclohydrolase n=1 Tax=Niveispirillum sp. TaxID=1917217 RepID=UPI003BA57F77
MIAYPLPDDAINAALAAVRFDADGLVPAIAQQHDSGEVLMMAWMNHDSIGETLRTGRVCYWSRSRQSFWRKGESSGQVQMLVEWRVDCDGDTLLLRVDQQGPACHTGRRSCFYRRAESGGLQVTEPVLLSPDALYGKKDPSPGF